MVQAYTRPYWCRCSHCLRPQKTYAKPHNRIKCRYESCAKTFEAVRIPTPWKRLYSGEELAPKTVSDMQEGQDDADGER